MFSPWKNNYSRKTLILKANHDPNQHNQGQQNYPKSIFTKTWRTDPHINSMLYNTEDRNNQASVTYDEQ